MDDVAEVVLRIADVLEQMEVPYALGGALALAYYAEPRATFDVDINIFVPETDGDPILRALADLGVTVDMQRDGARVRRDGQVRLRWDKIFIDLFFANFEFLESCRERVLYMNFRGRRMPVLSPEDLVICKVAYNRDKDWLDLREMLKSERYTLDRAYIMRWLTEIVGPDDPRFLRFQSLAP